MKDVSYHITDIVQNSLNAGATSIVVTIEQDSQAGHLTLRISDNGRGMPETMQKKVTDPFFTTSSTKKVGLGLPLLKQNTDMTEGTLNIHSVENEGTTVTAVFNMYHIDMIPMGDLAMAFKLLIAANPECDFAFNYHCDTHGFSLDTLSLRTELGDIPLNNTEVLNYLYNFISGNLQEVTYSIKEFKHNQY